VTDEDLRELAYRVADLELGAVAHCQVRHADLAWLVRRALRLATLERELGDLLLQLDRVVSPYCAAGSVCMGCTKCGP